MIPFNVLYKLKSLVRYNMSPRNRDETVAEHSYFVALFAYEICRMMKVSESLTLQVLEMALVHDLPEIWISDIPNPAKKFLNIGDQLRKKERESLKDDSHLQIIFDRLFENTLSSAIVKMADIVCVQIYADTEVKMGNKYFQKVLGEVEILKSKIIEDWPEFAKIDNKIIDDLKIYV